MASRCEAMRSQRERVHQGQFIRHLTGNPSQAAGDFVWRAFEFVDHPLGCFKQIVRSLPYLSQSL